MLVYQRFPFDKATESGMALPMLMAAIAVELAPYGTGVKAPTASLPPPSFRLLPGGANQFPGGSSR
jgi:hypothetical protein